MIQDISRLTLSLTKFMSVIFFIYGRPLLYKDNGILLFLLYLSGIYVKFKWCILLKINSRFEICMMKNKDTENLNHF